MTAPHPLPLPLGERGRVREFGISCLGFGAYYTLWMTSSNSFLSGRLDNDFRMIQYSSIVSN